MADREIIRGDLVTVADGLKTSPKGTALGTVLKEIKSEVGDVQVLISKDQRRATVTLSNGNLAAVRVAPPGRGPVQAPTFRFKRPADLEKYVHLYFGGIKSSGEVVVQRFTPNQLGSLKTISIRDRR